MADTNFESGAVRSADANDLRFDLIHPVAMIAIAKTYAEGAYKYGNCNWERGLPVHDLLNHVKRHLTMFEAGDRSEPHLPHAAWGLMAAVASDILWPELNAPHLRGPGCTLTPVMLAHQEAGDAERKRRRAAGDFDHLGDWSMNDIPEVRRILDQRAAFYGEDSRELDEEVQRGRRVDHDGNPVEDVDFDNVELRF